MAAWQLALTFTGLSVAAAAVADARVDYMLHCQGCHLPELEGSPGIVPGLRGDVGRIAGVPGGREYLVRVPGASQSPLSDAALAGVLNWIMENYNADTRPPDFMPFTTDEVARWRGNALRNPEATREEIFAPGRY
ncbi:MAG: hypothetical protein H6993_14025 [Pseudomonadales bacterium]|nr:hypothetical protein [Pseudomonadales bacterium]MCP5185077.1 hypothetical protein [Pseudomonadales bacterium]